MPGYTPSNYYTKPTLSGTRMRSYVNPLAKNPDGTLSHFSQQPLTIPDIGQSAPVPNSSITPYTQFKSTNSLGIDPQAANAASSFLGSYQAGKQVDPVSVGRAQNLPAEYYQKQIEDLSAPITAQYDKARLAARGDQAARGTIYDSQGYKDIGELDKSFLDQLGSITRGTQLERMKSEQGNEQDYLNRLMQEGQARRSAQLQQTGLDVNMINNLLGYGADRFKSEADLFGNIYGADTDFNKAVLDYNQPKYSDRFDTLARLLEAEGYQGVPQEQLWKEVANSLGFLNTGGNWNTK